MFELVSKYKPNGDQPEVIKELVSNNHVKYFVSYLALFL